VAGLVEHELDVAGEGHHHDGAEAFLVRFAIEVDAARAKGVHGGLDVVAHKANLMAIAGFVRRIVGRMNAEFAGRKGENQPAVSGIHAWESKNVTKHGAEGFRFRSVKKHVSADDGHDKAPFLLGRLIGEEKFLGALRGFDDGFDEGDAKLAFFELEDAIDGAAGGSGDGVFEKSGMRAGFENDLGGAEGGLGGEKSGEFAGEAHFDAAFGEGFENDVEESRAATGKAGDRVHIFFIDDNRLADRIEEGAREVEVSGGGEFPLGDGGDAGADHGGRVGHGADDGDAGGEAALDEIGGDGSGDGDEEFIGSEFGADFVDDEADGLRLGAEEDDVGSAGGGAVIAGRDEGEIRERLAFGAGMMDGGGNVGGKDEALFDKGFDQDAAHFAGADDGEFDCVGVEGHENGNPFVGARYRQNARKFRRGEPLAKAATGQGAGKRIRRRKSAEGMIQEEEAELQGGRNSGSLGNFGRGRGELEKGRESRGHGLGSDLQR
jgi:hypothetical protein